MLRRDADGRALRLAGLALAIASISHPSLNAQTRTPVAITLELSADGERHRDAIARAVEESVARYGEWLGPPGFERLAIVEGAGQRVSNPAVTSLFVTAPWPANSLSMDLESELAFATAMAWWRGLERESPLTRGLSWYLQSRIVERLVNLRINTLAYGVEQVHVFGGAVAWPIPSLRRSRWTAGLGRDGFLADGDGSAGRMSRDRLPKGVDTDSIRVALAFGTLERWLGWPVLQGGLRALSQESQQRTLSSGDAIRTLGTAVGQDLGWLLAPALDSAQRFDYALETIAVTPLEERCPSAPCYRTDVVIVRRGTAAFTGRSRPPDRTFESGDGIEVRVRFEDGQTVTARWDGRAERRELRFESPSRPERVWLDPDRVLLLDTNWIDSTRAMSPQTNVPVGKWIARWLVWLQDAALAYTALV